MIKAASFDIFEDKRWKEGDLRVGYGGVLADLGGDDGAEVRWRDDVLKVVDIHDCWDGSAGRPEEIEDSVPGFLKRDRVRWHLHAPECERHFYSTRSLQSHESAAMYRRPSTETGGGYHVLNTSQTTPHQLPFIGCIFFLTTFMGSQLNYTLLIVLKFKYKISFGSRILD